MTRSSPTFYIFHGSDDFSRDEQIAELCQRLGPPEMVDLNTTWLDGRKLTLGEFRHACEAIPFMASRRVVLITGLLSHLDRKEGGQGAKSFLQELLDLLPRLPETTRLIFVEERALLPRHPIVKLAQEHDQGYIHQFEPPKNLARWIAQRAERYGGKIDPAAAAQLAQIIGSNLRLLNQEIGKLVTYVGVERPISIDDISLLVPYVQEAVIFDFVDALGERSGRKAALLLQRLLDEGKDESYLLAMIIRQFRLLIQVKELKQAGEASPSIARLIKIHPYPAKKLYAQATNFVPEQLERIYRRLLETDVQIKSGELTPAMAIDLLVAGLTGGS
jgi:DNA polymerase-3 subunit delta